MCLGLEMKIVHDSLMFVSCIVLVIYTMYIVVLLFEVSALEYEFFDTCMCNLAF